MSQLKLTLRRFVLALRSKASMVFGSDWAEAEETVELPRRRQDLSGLMMYRVLPISLEGEEEPVMTMGTPLASNSVMPMGRSRRWNPLHIVVVPG